MLCTMPNSIEKTATLSSPLSQVWDAIADSKAFGTWFGMSIEGPFVQGQTVKATIAKTQVDEEIANHQEPYVGTPCELMIERIEPGKTLSFRWQPGAHPNGSANAPATCVSFVLEPVVEGTRLTIRESGFEALPPEDRANAIANNEGGWEAQLHLIGKYLARQALS